MDPVERAIKHAEMLAAYGFDEEQILAVVTGQAPMPPEWRKVMEEKNAVPPAPHSTWGGAAVNEGARMGTGLVQGGYDAVKELAGGLATMFTQNPLTTLSQAKDGFVEGVGNAGAGIYNAATSNLPLGARIAEVGGRVAALPVDALTGGAAAHMIDKGQDAVAEGDYRGLGHAITEGGMMMAAPAPLRAGSRVAGGVKAAAGAARHPLNAATRMGEMVRSSMAGAGQTGAGLRKVATTPVGEVADFLAMQHPAWPKFKGNAPGAVATPNVATPPPGPSGGTINLGPVAQSPLGMRSPATAAPTAPVPAGTWEQFQMQMALQALAKQAGRNK
jgi:hypothetical protein